MSKRNICALLIKNMIQPFTIGMMYSKFGLPLWLRRKRICLQCRRPRFNHWVGKIPWKRERLPTLVFLPGEFHRQRSLVGYSPWGHKELDITEQLTLLLYLPTCKSVVHSSGAEMGLTQWKNLKRL